MGRLFSAICLVAGTCIGGGMLLLPVSTGISGFFPSTASMLICWLAMTLSSFFLLEANLWLKEGAHVITMASTLLGPVGKVVAWCIYLFISYASLIAYTSAGGSIVVYGMQTMLDISISQPIGCLLFILFFGSILYFGSVVLGRINTILVVGMFVAYLALIATAIPEVKLELLKHQYWPTSFLAIPVLLTSFSFQTMLPSLTPYLNRHASALRWAIFGGTTLTLCIYLVWQGIVLGIVPVEGTNGLVEALQKGLPITQFLREHIQSSFVGAIAEFFSFFALVTSFLGIALGLFDFLSDGLKLPNQGWGKVLLSLLVVIPTFFFAAYFVRIFFLALETSGGFGDSILNGIMPVLMVWMGRYVYKFPDDHRTWGGKPLLILVFLFFLGTLILEILVQTGSICSLNDMCTLFSNYQNPEEKIL